MRRRRQADPGAKKLGDFFASCMDEAAIEKAGTRERLKPLIDKRQSQGREVVARRVTELHKAGIEVMWSVGRVAGLQGLDEGHHAARQRRPRPARARLLPRREVQGQARRVHRARRQDARARAKSPGARPTSSRSRPSSRRSRRRPSRARRPRVVQPDRSRGARRSRPSPSTGRRTSRRSASRRAANTHRRDAEFSPRSMRCATSSSPRSGQRTSRITRSTGSPTRCRRRSTTSTSSSLSSDGVEKRPERFKRCIDATTDALGELLGHQYADKYFPPAAKQSATSLVDAIVQAMHDDLTNSTGCRRRLGKPRSPSSRRSSAASVIPTSGRRTTSVKRDDYAGNALRASVFNQHRQLAKSGKPYDRSSGT